MHERSYVMRYYLMLALSMLVTGGCAGSHGGRALMEEASRVEFGSASYSCVETIAVAKATGYDYEKVVDQCLSKDKHALHTLFWLTEHAGFDAASSQGNATVLGLLLIGLGDKFFAECLEPEPLAVRNQVGQQIDYAIDGERRIENSEFRVKFPRTYAASFTVTDRVKSFVYSCRREVHGWQPHYAVAEVGVEAVPTLLSMMDDQRKVWVRIGAPQGGPQSWRVDVNYLFADDEGPRNSVAEFALLCICMIREPRSGSTEDFASIWDLVLHEFKDYDGRVSDETIDEIKKWYDSMLANAGR